MKQPFTVSRRTFLQATAAAGTLPLFKASGCNPSTAAPPDFPSSIPLYQQTFGNWDGEIVVSNVWTAAPRNPSDVVTIANWALANGWKVRPKGMGHGWSPLLLPPDSDGADFLLVDTTRSLTNILVEQSASPATVSVEAGVTMDTLLSTLGSYGLGLTAAPAPGDLTIGGALAIGAHGSAIRGAGEEPLPGKTYGSLSNLVLSLDAVVFDPWSRQYVLRTFDRRDPGIEPLLVHVGRSFITRATLQVGADVNLRCVSYFTIPASTVMAPPSQAGDQSFQSLVLQSGRAEIIWFPFTTSPWVKVWSIAPTLPEGSRAVTGPYNYPFANDISTAQSQAIAASIKSNPAATPGFENLDMSVVAGGLTSEHSADIWGPSRFTQLYVKPTTLQIHECGFAVMCSSSSIQKVVNDFWNFHSNLVAQYAARGQYPMNGPIEIRVTGLDRPEDVAMAGARPPLLGPLRPRLDHPEWDCCVWLDAGTIPGTEEADSFYSQLESFVLFNYAGAVRLEWSKGWAYTPSGAWTNSQVISEAIPAMYRSADGWGDGWFEAIGALDFYDPNRVFTNPFLDKLMPG